MSARKWISASPSTRTYRIEVEAPNPNGDIPDGITAEVAIPLAPVEAAQVPRSALTFSSAGDIGVEAEVAAAMAACLAESSDGIGRELGRGALGGMLIEYEKGTVLLHHVGSTAVFAVMCKDAAALGKVRYYVKKLLPDLARVM